MIRDQTYKTLQREFVHPVYPTMPSEDIKAIADACMTHYKELHKQLRARGNVQILLDVWAGSDERPRWRYSTGSFYNLYDPRVAERLYNAIKRKLNEN